ncbi:hypothetical protein [uncultured Secundilactobacillus sp.]|uniref:hypothetical protein n=1 Tax=uncultured Secundilactobacillus sp. TaxID=2813935 RepID=UPI002583CBB0|nr:hypothetical protein [uncultured Secundilactobacillus sp.]
MLYSSLKKHSLVKSSIVLIGTLAVGISISGSTGHAQSYYDSLRVPATTEINSVTAVPKMSLSQALQSGVHEAILTDLDVPAIANKLNAVSKKAAIASRHRFAAKKSNSKGKWVYMYTAEPYAFYRNSKTKEWKMVQVTPTVSHVVNTIVGGYVNSYGNHQRH